MSWLWPKFLPSNKLVHFAGKSSEGKSPITIDIIARVTSGDMWPDGQVNELGPRDVILMAGEDDHADTVKPRLRLANADMCRVKGVRMYIPRDEKKVELSTAIDRDYNRLMQAAESLPELALIVIDPVTNYLGQQSMNKEEEIRGNISMPLVELAKNKGCCIITVGHLNRRGAEASVLERAMGAAAFTGVARKAFVFGPVPDDDNKYAHIMAEARDKQVAIKYETKASEDPEGKQKSPIITIGWGEMTDVDLDMLINGPKQRDKSTAKQVRTIVMTLLSTGMKTAEAIEQALKDQGIPPDFQWQRTINKVAKSKKGGPEGKGEKTMWWIESKQSGMEFDK